MVSLAVKKYANIQKISTKSDRIEVNTFFIVA